SMFLVFAPLLRERWISNAMPVVSWMQFLQKILVSSLMPTLQNLCKEFLVFLLTVTQVKVTRFQCVVSAQVLTWLPLTVARCQAAAPAVALTLTTWQQNSSAVLKFTKPPALEIHPVVSVQPSTSIPHAPLISVSSEPLVV